MVPINIYNETNCRPNKVKWAEVLSISVKLTLKRDQSFDCVDSCWNNSLLSSTPHIYTQHHNTHLQLPPVSDERSGDWCLVSPLHTLRHYVFYLHCGVRMEVSDTSQQFSTAVSGLIPTSSVQVNESVGI